MPTKTRQISLRSLARSLGCDHSSLSAAIHNGRVTRGVRFDNGKVVIVDADAVASDWRAVHYRVDIRSAELDAKRVERAARRLAATQPEAVELHDVALDRRITAAQLFEERDALSLLASALVHDALTDRSAQTFKTRISKRLREVAELHGAGAPEIARAWDELQSSIDLVKLLDEDEAAEDDTGDKAEP